MLKGTPLAPLTGVLDLRSPPDELPAGAMRWRQNFRTVDENKLRRGHGFEKLLSKETDYNNDDLHDQLLSLSGAIRQPPTLAFEAESSRGVRSLFVANESTIFQHNANTGNYKVAATGFGAGGTSANGIRFKAARQGDYVIFTNDYNSPRYHLLESASTPLVKEFDDLATIGLSKAAFVFVWKNVVFFADVEMDQQRFPFRIVWGDYDNPTSVDPLKAESIADLQDLDSNERILGGAVAGDVFIIYTTRGMWQITVVGGDNSFGFRRLYDGARNEYVGLLKYPNTLVSLGTTHLYVSDDKIYSFSPYQQLPSCEEWIHRASKKLMDELNPLACGAHIGGLDHDEVYFSIARVGDDNDCPSLTLRLNMRYKVADYLDYGFTTFSNFQPYYGQNIRDFILDNRICDLDSLTADGMGFVNEGLPRTIPGPTALFEPQSICTQTPLVVSGVTTEDYTGACDGDSLCALLDGAGIDDFCRKCDTARLFIAVSSNDWCLKQLNTVFYRELCTNPTASGTLVTDGYFASVGIYEQGGIESILRFAPAYSKDGDVVFTNLDLKFLAAAEEPANAVKLRVGISAQPADPNTDECGIVWHAHSDLLLKCITALTQGEHLSSNTQPYLRSNWNFVRRGHFIYIELRIVGTGGDAIFSGIVASLSEKSVSQKAS